MPKAPTMIFVRAAPGRRVRDPQTLHVLSDAGELKPATSYWLRRIQDADVILGAPPAKQVRYRSKAAEVAIDGALTTDKE